MATEKELRAKLTAKTDLDAVEEFADALDEVEDREVEAKVGIDESQVARQVDDVRADLERLADETVHPQVKVEVDDAALADARRRIASATDDTGASQAGQRYGATFARDFGGVINQQASSIGGDLTEGIATAFEAFGVSASLAGPLVAALGIGTVVAGAAATLWQALNSNAETYKKLLEDSAAIQQQIAEGDLAAANRESAKLLLEMGPALQALGVDVQAAAGFMRGAATDVGVFNAALTDEERTNAIKRLQDTLNLPSWGDAVDLFNTTRTTLQGMRQGYLDAETAAHQLSLASLAQAKADLARGVALDDVNAALMEQAKVAGPSAQRAIFDYVAEINGIPESKLTEIRTDTNPDDVAQVQAEIDALARARTVVFNMQANWDREMEAWLRAGAPGGFLGFSNAGPSTVQQNITVNAGFGTDAFAVQTAVLNSARQVARLARGARRNG